MNSTEWLNCANPNEMLYHRDVVVSARKLRLFVAACCRRLLGLGFPIRREARVLERFADGQASAAELAEVAACGRVKYDEGLDNNEGVIHYHACSALEAAAAPRTANPFAAVACAYAFAWQNTRFSLEEERFPSVCVCDRGEEKCRGCPLCRVNRVHVRHDAEAEAAWRGERRRQCDLLRDLLGDPFRPVALDRAWVSRDMLAIARRAYEVHDGALPVLADALEEAGCDDEDVLAHCREPGEHVRGCWVLDAVLGKEGTPCQERATLSLAG